MTMLPTDRNTPQLVGNGREGPVAAGAMIFAGALVARNAAGLLVKAIAAPDLIGVGRADRRVDNRRGGDGDLRLPYVPGVFRFDNAVGAEQITTADIGNLCFVLDDQTVTRTSDGDTRSPAGIVDWVDSAGVWVLFDEALTRAAAGAVPTPVEPSFQPLAGYLDAPNVTVLGASHASGTFGTKAGLNSGVADRFAMRGWTGALRCYAFGGAGISSVRGQWNEARAVPAIEATQGQNVWIVDAGGNDVMGNLPYPNHADVVGDLLRDLVTDIQASGDKVIFLPQTKRYAPWSGLTEASNLETDGILPYNLGVIDPLIAELTPDWADATGSPYINPYKLGEDYRGLISSDGNHGYGPTLGDFIFDHATSRINAIAASAPRSGSIIWRFTAATTAYIYGVRNQVNAWSGGPDAADQNHLSRFNYMVGAGKTDGGVDDFVTLVLGPFRGGASGPGISGASRVADPEMATADILSSTIFAQDLGVGYVEIHGLLPSAQVQLSIVAASANGSGRNGRYTLTGGEEAVLQAGTSSPSNYHKFSPIAVPSDGKVRLDFVSATGAGGFALLNALRLDYL